ncbi:MAG: hypothetical protein QF704_16860 [Anaerolineales bacterium]|nr:hypothetical protein [Anaerolineales bacterium]
MRQLYAHFNIPRMNRFGNLKLTMFQVGGSVKLRGKAGEVRAIGPVLHRIWQMHYNSNLEIHNKIELCLRMGCRMEAILDDHRDYFALPGEFCPRCLMLYGLNELSYGS